MQKKSLEDLKAKDLTELDKEISAKRIEIAKSIAELRVGKEKNLKKVKNLRRDLAQTLTIKREKEFMIKEEAKNKERKEEEK